MTLPVLLALAPAARADAAELETTPAYLRASFDGDVDALRVRPASAPVAFADAGGSPRLALVDTAQRAVRATVVDFDVAYSREMRLEVRNLEGRLIRTIAEGRWAEGRHQLAWQHDSDEGSPVRDGLYVVRLVASPRLGQLDQGSLAR